MGTGWRGQAAWPEVGSVRYHLGVAITEHQALGGTGDLCLDIGCGSLKRDGFVGVDILDVADYQCDIATERLPFPDSSASHIFSSHCLEHIPPAQLAHVFREFTRVAKDGALLELWHPFSMHRDAFIWDHKTFLNEEHYYHIAYRFPDHWEPILGGRWTLDEIRYNVEERIVLDLLRRGVDLDFAVNYLQSVVREMGAFLRVWKSPLTGDPPAFRRSICDGRRDHVFRVVGRGPYADSVGVSTVLGPPGVALMIRSVARAGVRRLPARLRGRLPGGSGSAW